MKLAGHWYADRKHYFAAIQIQSWYVLCVIICALAVLDTMTTNLAGLHSFEVLIPSETESPNFFMGADQKRFESIRFSAAQFGAIRC